MTALTFTWDPAQARANLRKHRVAFEEARSVFEDELALLIPDPDHSDDEERFVILGMSSSPRMLVVCHCYRAADDEIRIISARRAIRSERLTYRRREIP
jgi:hypothetical protein